MRGMPLGSGACCPPRAAGVTYLKIGPRGIVVGMIGLETVFKQLYLMGRRPEEATDAELVGMARRSNYIARRATLEADYAVALREAYQRFCASQEVKQERNQE